MAFAEASGLVRRHMQASRYRALKRRQSEFLVHEQTREVAHTVQVTSPGGCGTTAIYEHLALLGLNIPSSDDYRPYKHQRSPPKEAQGDLRVLFLFSDPRNSLISIFRRGVQFHHYWRMRRDIRGRPYPENLRSLERYLEVGVDEFRVDEQIRNWLEPVPSPVLVARYEALEQSWPEIAAFLGVPRADMPFVASARLSDWTKLPQPHRDRCAAICASTVKLTNSLPDLHYVDSVRGGKQ